MTAPDQSGVQRDARSQQDPVRVAVPPPIPPQWAAAFRSAERVWSNLVAELPAPGFEIVRSDPDVWLWDAYQELPPAGRPLVGVLHEAPAEGEGLSEALVEHADRIGQQMADRARRVVTCSSASRQRIAERYGIEPERIDVAPYGVDASIFRPDGPTAAPSDLEAAGADARPYVLFVGTVLPRKNLPMLRAAMTEIPTHQLVLVASPCLDASSPRLLAEAVAPLDGRPVANLAGIDVHGLASLMRGAALLCLPSLSEGFGLPVVEAMACGTPVVVSARGSLPEVVADGGVIVEPSLGDLVSGLRAALSSRAELSARALQRGQSFTWARTAEIARSSIANALRQ